MKMDKEDIRKIIRALIISAPERCYEIVKLIKDYKESEGDHIPYSQFEYKSLTSFLQSFHDFLLYDAGGKKYIRCSESKASKHMHRLVQEQKKTKPTKPPREGRDITRNPWPFFCGVQSNTYSNQNYLRSTDKMKKPDDCSNSSFVRESAQAIPSYALSEAIEQLDTDFSWVGRLSKYSLEEKLKVDSIIKIFVTEVYSPSEIWFNIFDEDRTPKVLGMLEKMQEYYRSSFEERLMPISSQENKGRAAVVYYGGKFRRAILLRVQGSKVHVLLADYGRLADIDAKNVAFLVDEFATFSAQAAKGKLAYVTPTLGDDWSDSVNQHLAAEIYGQFLHAKIIEIEEDTKKLHLVLLAERDEKIVKINKDLIKMGYARLCV